MRLRRGFEHLSNLLRALGISGTIKYLWCHSLERGKGADYWLRPKRVAGPLWIRRGTSDVDVFKQIFIEPEYADLADLKDVGLVIDCGANVGYSAAYFLATFPQCFVIAIEPDAGNFEILQRNLTPYGDRVKLMRCGVWSHSVGLTMSGDVYYDGREWSRQVRVCVPNEIAEFEGINIGAVFASSGFDRISLLKMDVEGTEAVVFAENYRSWLDKVDTIAIELHDDSTFGKGSEVFYSAIDGQDFQISKSGERTVCRRK